MRPYTAPVESRSRDRVQTVSRIVALVFVVGWLFSARLQSTIPFWLPFAILLAMEVEFVVRGIRERRGGAPAATASRRLPGTDDADLGWVESFDDEGEPILVPAAPRARRRTSGRLLLMLVVGVVLFAFAYRVDRDAGWSAVASVDKSRAEQRFSAEASRIAGRSVRVYCDDAYAFTGVGSDAAGVAFIPRALAYLEPTICRSLYRIAFEGELGPRSDAAFAITVLAHEATHLRGVRNEAETECYALQEGVQLGRRLGLAASTARELMEAQRAYDLSDASVARLDYRLPADCRDGGSLDLRPNDTRFP
jgi:hypothetical protein